MRKDVFLAFSKLSTVSSLLPFQLLSALPEKLVKPRPRKHNRHAILTFSLQLLYTPSWIFVRRRFRNIRTRKQPNRYIIPPPQSMVSGRPRLTRPEFSWIPSRHATYTTTPPLQLCSPVTLSSSHAPHWSGGGCGWRAANPNVPRR